MLQSEETSKVVFSRKEGVNLSRCGVKSYFFLPYGGANLRTDESVASPDSEQIEHSATLSLMRNSVSVKQI